MVISPVFRSLRVRDSITIAVEPPFLGAISLAASLVKGFRAHLLRSPDFRSTNLARRPLQAAARVRAWRLSEALEGVART